jgi:uncharacterized membrane protein YqjE
MLLESIKGLGETLIEVMRIKVEILSLDVKESRIRFISLLMLGVFSLLLLTLGIILGVFWLIIAFWESDRLLIMGVLSGIILFSGMLMLTVFLWKLKHSPEPFASSIAELNKDSAALGLLASRDRRDR